MSVQVLISDYRSVGRCRPRRAPDSAARLYEHYAQFDLLHIHVALPSRPQAIQIVVVILDLVVLIIIIVIYGILIVRIAVPAHWMIGKIRDGLPTSRQRHVQVENAQTTYHE